MNILPVCPLPCTSSMDISKDRQPPGVVYLCSAHLIYDHHRSMFVCECYLKQFLFFDICIYAGSFSTKLLLLFV